MSGGRVLSMKTVIRCRDFACSRDFYTRVLGFAVAEEWEEPQGRGAIFHVEGVGACIEIYGMTHADSRFHESFQQALANDKIDIQLETESLASWVRRLEGVWAFEGPEDLPWGQRWIRLRDPDRLLIAIYERK